MMSSLRPILVSGELVLSGRIESVLFKGNSPKSLYSLTLVQGPDALPTSTLLHEDNIHAPKDLKDIPKSCPGEFKNSFSDFAY